MIGRSCRGYIWTIDLMIPEFFVELLIVLVEVFDTFECLSRLIE